MLSDGIVNVRLIGIGKSSHLSSLGNWTNNSAAVCADPSPFNVWDQWDVATRDLFILNAQGQLVFHENITGGFNSNEISDLIRSLLVEPITCDEIEDLYSLYHEGEYLDCNFDQDCFIEQGHCSVGLGGCYYSVNSTYESDLVSSLVEDWINEDCIEGVCDCFNEPYPICNNGTCDFTYCLDENPQGCFNGSECDDGYSCIDNWETDCTPSSCWCDELTGNWYCTEDCNGGSCVLDALIGDINNDLFVNVLDVVIVVSFILGNDSPTDIEFDISDINNDGFLNVLDVVSLVDIVLNP